jgi:NAD(P)-dependent dehydrogenase (short-subunit alcohol dehydrogenase family)
MSRTAGVIGVSDHGGWAILVTVARDGTILDRRRVELVDDNLPAIPHHHEAQLLPTERAVALVEEVRLSAERHAVAALDAVAKAVPQILGIALRNCPELPPTIAERISDYRARNVADWVMYRKALADAAQARGWPVHWYDPKKVLSSAGHALHVPNFDDHFLQLRSILGPPWNQDHKLAMAAALTTTRSELML